MRFKPLNLDYHAEAANAYGCLYSTTRSRPSLTICLGQYEKNGPKGRFGSHGSTQTGSLRRQSPPSTDHEAISRTNSPMDVSESIEEVETSSIAMELSSSRKQVDMHLIAEILRRIESACKAKYFCNEPWSERLRSRNCYGGNFHLWGRCLHLLLHPPTLLHFHPIQPERGAVLRYSKSSIQSKNMNGCEIADCLSKSPTEVSHKSVEGVAELQHARSSLPPVFRCFDLPIDKDSKQHAESGFHSKETEDTSCLALVRYVAPDHQPSRNNEQENWQPPQSCPRSSGYVSKSSIHNEGNSPTRQVKFSKDIEVGEKHPVSDLVSVVELKTDDIVKRDATHISGEDTLRAARKKVRRDKKKRKRERRKLEALSHLDSADTKLACPSRAKVPPLSTEHRQAGGSHDKKQQSIGHHAVTSSQELHRAIVETKPTSSKSQRLYFDATLASTGTRVTAPKASSLRIGKKGKFQMSVLSDANPMPLMAGVVCARKDTKQERMKQLCASNSSTRRPSLFDDPSVGGDPKKAPAAKRWFEQTSKRKAKKKHGIKKRAERPSQSDILLDDPVVSESHGSFPTLEDLPSPLAVAVKSEKVDQAFTRRKSRANTIVEKQTEALKQERNVLDHPFVGDPPPCPTVAERSAKGNPCQTKSQFPQRDQMFSSNQKIPAKPLSKAHNGGNVAYFPHKPRCAQPLQGRATRKSRESEIYSKFANSQHRAPTNENKSKASSSATPSYYMTLGSDKTKECAKQPSVQHQHRRPGLMVPRVHPGPQPTFQESGENTAQIKTDSDIPRSNMPELDFAKVPQDAVQDDHTACATELQLLCTEPFLDSWGDVVAELGRMQDQVFSDSQSRQRIVLFDTPLMNFSGVDIELPGRCGVLLFDAATSLNSTEQAKAAVLDVARLAAIGRYVQVFAFICVQRDFSAETAKHLIQLQCAAVPARGLPETVFSFQILLRKQLPEAIASTVYSQEGLSTGSVLGPDLLRAVSESTTRERAIFLQALIPVLSPTGALEMLHMAKNLLPNGCPFFQMLFKNQRVLQKIALLASSTERSTSIHPHAIRQLVRVTQVAIAPARSPNGHPSGCHA